MNLSALFYLEIKFVSSLKNISPYGICGVTGFILGMIYIVIICKKKKLNFNDYIYIYVWAALGAIIGAKILYISIELPQIIKSLMGTNDIYKIIKNLMSSGFVFYGGLLGSIIFAYLACIYFGAKKEKTIGILTPAMPLAHSIGRIGCTVVGCCYGIEITNGLGIVYSKSNFAPLGVKLFPVQIVESIADILIFSLLVYLIKKNKPGYVILKTYLVIYALLRFILEFLRGDEERGKLGVLSTSQWIGLIIVVVILSIMIKKHLTNRINMIK